MIKFGRFILESENPSRLYHFLSFIFDVEANSDEENNILFEFEELRFLIKKDAGHIQSYLDFSLEVDSLEELKEFFQRVEFYYYKEGIQNKSIELTSENLVFSDPDNRVWRVELMNGDMYAVSSRQANEFANVRIC